VRGRDLNHRTGAGRFPNFLNNAADRLAVVKFVESIDAQTAPFN